MPFSQNYSLISSPLTRPYLAGSEAASVPELLQYASDQDCLSLQLAVQEVELDILAGDIREIIESSLHTTGALLFRGLKVVLINVCLIFHSVPSLVSPPRQCSLQSADGEAGHQVRLHRGLRHQEGV